eukprot:1844333-Pyramimonas_sp.AAC.1
MRDALVHTERYWDSQTDRPLRSGDLKIGKETISLREIHRLTAAKCHSATLKEKRGELEPKVAAATRQAAQDVNEGKLNDYFTLIEWHTVSGTRRFINMEDVITYRAREILELPPDLNKPNPCRIDKSQSSNLIFPIAIADTAHKVRFQFSSCEVHKSSQLHCVLVPCIPCDENGSVS